MQDFSSFNSIREYEKYQKKRILQVLLLATAAITLPLAASNFLRGDLPATYSIFVLLILCLLGLYLNWKDKYTISAVIFSLSVYLVIIFNMIDGAGLRDPAIVTFPIITVFGNLLFNQKISNLFTVLSSVLVVSIYLLQVRGIFQTDYPTNHSVVITIVSILIAMSMIQFTVMRFWRRNLDWVLHSEEEMKQAYHHTLEGWAKALEYRDRETEGHSRRVVALSVELARAMGVEDEEMLESIMRGALLHDIGKMAIPDSILLKNSSLTEEEWAVIKSHPELAKEMMTEIPFLANAMEIPCFHHERWDGRGYPTGLERENIPLSARIFAVIDNYDALTSDRPYRKAWSREKTLQYIQENSGKKFDPAVVEVFLGLMKKDNLSLGGIPKSI